MPLTPSQETLNAALPKAPVGTLWRFYSKMSPKADKTSLKANKQILVLSLVGEPGRVDIVSKTLIDDPPDIAFIVRVATDLRAEYLRDEQIPGLFGYYEGTVV